MSEDIKFRKTKNNQTIAIKEGEVVGGAGTSVGPDNLPLFDVYRKNHEGKSISKVATYYVKDNYCNGIKSISKPNGVPVADEIIFTTNGAKETGRAITENKLLVLPYIADIYRTGEYLGSAKGGERHNNVERFHYTQKTISVNGKKYKVTLCSKEMKEEVGGSLFRHYLIDKADLANDTRKTLASVCTDLNPKSKSTEEAFDESLTPNLGKNKKVLEFFNIEVEEMTHDRLEFGIAWDGMESVREVDDNGFLHVKKSPLTRVQVAPYLGKEIPTWEKLGFDPEKTYYAYRPAEELEKYETINSVNGIPIHLLHHDDEGREEDKETRIGSTGTDARFFYPFLWNSLHIYDKEAQDRINDGSMKELSLGYSYEVDPTSGETDKGEHYDFVMRNIRANHLALVEAGRAGPRVKVLDTSSNLIKEKVMDKDEKVQDQSEEVEAKVDETEAMDEDKDAEIKRLTEQVAEYLSPEELEKFKNSLTDLAYSKATGDDGEEVAEVEEKEVTVEDDDPELDEKFKNPDFKDGFEAGVRYGEKREKLDPKRIDRDHEREGEERYLESHDDDKLVEDALKACGLDDADEEEKQAFAAGLRYAGKKDEAQDEECGKAKAADTIDRVRKAITAEMRAIEETAPILGKTRLGAYDSAGAIYASALSKVGIRGVAKDHARSAFRAYMQGRGQSTRTEAKDSAESFQPTGLTKILTKVGI